MTSRKTSRSKEPDNYDGLESQVPTRERMPEPADGSSIEPSSVEKNVELFPRRKVIEKER
jgi:hypothetical protein